MITYLAIGGNDSGWGTTSRAAALLRDFDDVTVLTCSGTAPLEHFNIPHERIARHQIRYRHFPGLVIADTSWRPGVAADLWVWRRGRPLPRHPHVLWAEPADAPAAGVCWPLLALRPEEILDRAAARIELGVDPEAPLTVRVGPGTGADLVLEDYPALRYLRAADHVIGAAGANLWGEIHALGLPVTWHARHHEQQARLDSPPELWTDPDPTATDRARAHLARLLH